MPYDLLDLFDRPGGCSSSRPQDSMVRSLGGGDADVLFRIWFGADDDEMEAAGSSATRYDWQILQHCHLTSFKSFCCMSYRPAVVHV